MPLLRWLGPGTYTDNGRGFSAAPGTEHDLPDEQADEYLTHSLFGDRWERVGDDPGSTGDDTAPDTPGDDLTELSGVGDTTADRLAEAGYGSFDALAVADAAAVAGDVEGLSESDVEDFQQQLSD